NTAVDELTASEVGVAGENVVDFSEQIEELDVSDIQGLDESVLPGEDADSLFDKSGKTDLADSDDEVG
ncbi:MAG TPA: hypothetical protein VJN20_09340, partial [Burkholderiales bacterium]|nr:hypothetical protein [Burkholderiales bacterium]